VEAQLIIIAIGFVFLLAALPKLETRIILFPVEVVKKAERGLGCLPHFSHRSEVCYDDLN
jgi:hypothetical protein